MNKLDMTMNIKYMSEYTKLMEFSRNMVLTLKDRTTQMYVCMCSTDNCYNIMCDQVSLTVCYANTQDLQ